MSDFKLTYFKLTYASMFNPPEEVHERFEASLADVKANQLGKTHAMLINNKDMFAESTYENRSPINHNWLLARLQAGTSQQADSAIAAARKNCLVQYPQTDRRKPEAASPACGWRSCYQGNFEQVK